MCTLGQTYPFKKCIDLNDLGEALNKHDDAVNNMLGWFQKLLKSRGSSSTCEQEANVTKNSLTPDSSLSSSFTSSSSPGTTPSNPLSSRLRWSLKYDVFVCHSLEPSDTEQAIRLVSFLEASPRSLRCFLLHRDICPGGAFSTELCEAVQNSHLRALLITPNFLQDDWCTYVMHQALAEGPMSNRMLPLVHNLPLSQYPRELRFYFYNDLSKNPDRGYTLVYKTVLKYLQDMVKKEKPLDCNMDSSSSGLSGEGSSQEDQLKSKYDPSETSVALEVKEDR